MSKSLIKNSIYNVAYKLLNVIFPLVTTTYVSHILQVEGIGKVAYAQNIVSYFIMLAALGMPTYGTREISKIRESKHDTDKLFTELFIVNFISTLTFSIAYFILIFNIDNFRTNILMYCAVGVTLIFNIINIDWYFQGKEQYEYITIRSFIVKVLSLIAILVFIKHPNDYIKYALISSLGIVGNYLFNIFSIKKQVRFNFKNINITRHITTILVLFASTVAVGLYTMIDTTMIGFFCSEIEVGYYTNSIKLVNIVQAVISAMGAILLPRLSYYYEQGKIEEYNKLFNKAFKILMTFAIPSSIGLFMIAENIIMVLFGNTFEGSILTLKILSFTLPILVINVHFGLQVLISLGHEKKYLITVCIGAIINCLLNPILIINFKQNGAAIASLISEIAVSIFTIIFSNKYIRFKVEFKFIKSIIISITSMIIAIQIVKLLHIGMFNELMLSIISGACLYFTVNYMLENESVLEIFSIIKSKSKIENDQNISELKKI